MNTDAAVDQSVRQIARYVSCRGMETPAIFLLECMRPFSGSMALAAEAFIPVLSVMFGEARLKQLQMVLANHDALTHLVTLLEEARSAETTHG